MTIYKIYFVLLLAAFTGRASDLSIIDRLKQINVNWNYHSSVEMPHGKYAVIGDVSQLSPGLYFLQLDNSKIHRFVKE